MSSLPLAAAPSARARARAAWATRAQFFVSGALFATWGVQVPAIKAHYALGERALAIAMLAAGVGAVVALTQAGRLVSRFGPRAVTLAGGVTAAAAIALMLAFRGYAALLAVMLAYGAAGSLMDVAFNAEASEIERLEARPLMSGFHAMFSLGGMAGAAVGSALYAASVAPARHLAGAAAAGAAVIVVAAAAMLRATPGPSLQAPLGRPAGPLLLMGVLAGVGLVSEGAMYDWSVLYLRQEVGADASTAALAYASFSAAMAAGRFAGDAVRARLHAVALLRASGALAAAGMALALLVPQPGMALLGFALVGLGLANVVPVLFSAAAAVPGVAPAHGIATVSALGYLGMMAGPPVIGVIAQDTSLAWGLVTVVVAAVMLVAGARRALPP